MKAYILSCHGEADLSVPPLHDKIIYARASRLTPSVMAIGDVQ